MTVQEALNLAIRHHNAGQIAEAQNIYAQILTAQPNHADAMHLMGAARMQRGSPAEAVDWIRGAIAINPNVADWHITLGVALDGLDRMDEALIEFRRGAELAPNRPEVLANLGNALRKAGKVDESITVCRRALSIHPDQPAACINLGLALREKSVGGSPEVLEEAIRVLRKASVLSPKEAQPLVHLALCFGQKRQWDQGIECCRKALVAQPGSAEAHNVMGSLFREMGRLEEAAAESRQALAIRPTFVEGHLYLGLALRDLGKIEEAAQCFRSAIALRPQNAEAHNALGHVLCTLGQYAESESACRQALALQPNFDEALNNLGLALQGQSRWDDSIAALQAALAVRPNFAEAHNNMSIAQAALGKTDLSIASLHRALELRPDYPSAHWNLGLRLLADGDYEHGWPEYEWRRRIPEFRLRTNFPCPMWDGADLNGRRILIHNEQGFGDAIQFMRFLPLVARRGGKIILACQDSLRRLCQRMEGVELCVSPTSPDPPCDVQCPLMSLGTVFKTTINTIPAQVPYLSLDPEWKRPWESRLPTDGRKKIGFIWANKPNPANRCPAPAAWAPIARIGGVWFCSLQRSDVGDDARTAPPGVELTDWTSDLRDFADTAALIDQLDLIVTVDTAAAHLAGALGKPAWMLLKFAPDWRWMLHRADSPWYPTMRLFRQPTLGDWDTPIAEICRQLAAFANS
ncbi:MAG TPA: tetratricopeptide repeat protein [Tepidisphaeraceae bacterium]|nr:tetratricopeptide repeat protein [Tepidisphaeraceae bacterium]